jgi:NDP-sugar pyrophosphorylase family protein
MRRPPDEAVIKDIDVVILSGGLGTRLRSIVSDRPKTMAEIGGHPFLNLLIKHISSYGPKRFIICAGYMAEYIEKYYASAAMPWEIILSYEKTLLGTGGAVKNAGGFIKSSPFIVMNGDSFCNVNLHDFFRFHKEKGAIVSMVVVENETKGDTGSIILDDSGRIISFREKEGCGNRAFVNAGIYLMEKEILSLIPPDTKFSLEYDLFPNLINRNFYGHVADEGLYDIGTPEGYKKTDMLFKTILWEKNSQ